MNLNREIFVGKKWKLVGNIVGGVVGVGVLLFWVYEIIKEFGWLPVAALWGIYEWVSDLFNAGPIERMLLLVLFGVVVLWFKLHRIEQLLKHKR